MNGTVRSTSRKLVLTLIWFSMLMAVGIYGLVGFLFAESVSISEWPAGGEETLRQAFTILAILLGAATVWWRRRVLSKTPPPSAAELQRTAIAVWTLSDGVALFGLVLCFLTRDFYQFVAFGLATVALLLLHRPSVFASRQSRSFAE